MIIKVGWSWIADQLDSALNEVTWPCLMWVEVLYCGQAKPWRNPNTSNWGGGRWLYSTYLTECWMASWCIGTTSRHELIILLQSPILMKFTHYSLPFTSYSFSWYNQLHSMFSKRKPKYVLSKGSALTNSCSPYMVYYAVSALHAFSLFTDMSYYSHAVVDLGGGIKGTFSRMLMQ